MFGRGTHILTLTSLIMGSAASPSVERHSPKKREKVIMPRMFMSTAAAATLSGNMLRATSRRASNGVLRTTGSAGARAAACAKPIRLTTVTIAIIITITIMIVMMAMRASQS